MTGFQSNVATVLVACIVVLVAGVGGVIVIVHPETLSFSDYADKLKDLAIGVGILGVGRGIASAGNSGTPAEPVADWSLDPK